MNILICCTKYSLDPKNNWLTNELAESFKNQGHDVKVILLDWKAVNNQTYVTKTPSGIELLVLAPYLFSALGVFIKNVTKWILSSHFAKKHIKEFLKDKNIDLLIGFSPAVSMAASLKYCIKNLSCKSCLIQWDFFPFHQQKIGLLKNPILFKIGYFLENKIIRKFDVIGCMTEKNSEYFQSKYQLQKAQKVCVVPVWGKQAESVREEKTIVRKKFGLPLNESLVIFGGQLIAGRGIETILEVANIAKIKREPIKFLILGSGPYETIIQQRITAGLDNIIFKQWIPRDDYVTLLTACDVGLVCLVEDLDIPTFPSKSIDYFRVGLPILASVSQGAEYAEFLQKNDLGISVDPRKPEDFFIKLKELLQSPELGAKLGLNGKQYFCKNLEVTQVCNKILYSIDSSKATYSNEKPS